jgi:alkylated DNA repair protein alkB family protein 6
MVATVSLGSHTVLNLQPKRQKDQTFRILQEAGSLLISTDYIYGDYLHGIDEVTVDEALSEDTIANWSLLANPGAYVGDVERKTRTSLTFRDVLKVVKVKF